MGTTVTRIPPAAMVLGLVIAAVVVRVSASRGQPADGDGRRAAAGLDLARPATPRWGAGVTGISWLGSEPDGHR